MTTKVFISWSGELSKKLAKVVSEWLPGVLQYVKPYFTPDDIEKGAKWSTEISNNLEDSEIGIICLTRDNLEKPWILFEAGALSKNFGKAKVCTLLFGIDSTDLSGPLTGFQDTKFQKEDFKKLIETVNKAGGDLKLDPKVLDEVFEMWWKKLELQVLALLRGDEGNVNIAPKRSDREILEEILDLTRLRISKPIRRNRISRSSIQKFMDYYEENYSKVWKYGNTRIIRYFEELLLPIRDLCMEAGEPELYESVKAFQMHFRNNIFSKSEKDESTDS